MGMFDEIEVECPHCKELHIEQTKLGGCSLMTYTLGSCPPHILGGLLEDQDNGFPIHCEHCNEEILLKVWRRLVVKTIGVGNEQF